jgi:hypothetical protein
MSPAAAEPVSNSPFLRLPAELRNRIYELVIEGSPRVASLHTSRRSAFGIACEHIVRFTAEYDTSEPALLAVCRKIRREAMGIFVAIQPCKVVLFAYSRDEAEISHWEDQLLHLFSSPGSMAGAFLVEADSPSLKAWERATRWLKGAQNDVSYKSSTGEMGIKKFESNNTTILCAVRKIARNPSRKPWDLVEDESAEINILLYGVRQSLEKDIWSDA